MKEVMSKIAVPLTILMMLGFAVAQSNNLVRNPDGDDGLRSWRVSGNAAASDCISLGKCFAINQDAFVYQDVDLPDNVTGMYALFISLASIEQSNTTARGRAYTHGYFMTGGELRKATILANLSGQEMESPPTTNGQWVKQFGVFRVPEQTGRIRIFLRSGCGKAENSIDCVTHFRRAGIFLFGSEDEAKAFVSSYQ